MIIKKLTIKNFGKIHNRTLELSPGINVLYGENESGKTTIHTFIKSMFYGITRQRGKAARNDVYSTYEPWENPAGYGGILWFECEKKSYRLTRGFYKESPFSELLCEDTGELTSTEKGTLEGILGGVSEAVYDNTVSVGQLKSVTGQDLVRELQNYMASYQGTGDSSIDLGRAAQMLKMSRKGFLTQADKRKKEIVKEQDKIVANMEYLRQEMEELTERLASVSEKEKPLRAGEESGETVLDARIDAIEKHRTYTWVGVGAMLILGTAGAVLASGKMLMTIFLAGGIFLALGCLGRNLQLGRELNKKKRLKERLISRQEKLKWSRENIEASYHEKEMAFHNLEEEYRECEEQLYLPSSEELEIQALNLAMKTIEEISGNINHQVGGRLRQRTSQILSEITGGKYGEVLMDENFKMSVDTGQRVVSLERLSRGTLEQIYFALRMAAGELLCGKERFPVILDDVFGMYDEERLGAVLRWLHKEQKQIIISTCHKREMEILEKEGIPYQKLLLSPEEE